MELKNNIFNNSKGSSGGGIFIKQNYNNLNINFYNNTFQNCIADVGSSIRILGSSKNTESKILKQEK